VEETNSAKRTKVTPISHKPAKLTKIDDAAQSMSGSAELISMPSTNTLPVPALAEEAVNNMSLDNLAKCEHKGRQVWKLQNVSPEQLLHLVNTPNRRVEYYVDDGEYIFMEKIEGIDKSNVIPTLFGDYIMFLRERHTYNTTSHVDTFIPDGTVYYDPLRHPTMLQATHALAPGRTMPLWVAEVEYSHLVGTYMMGRGKVEHLMTLVGADGSRIEEAWLFVMRQPQAGEQPLANRQDPANLVPIAAQAGVPVLSHDVPMYVAIYTRQPVGVNSAVLAPVRYYPLAPDTTFAPPADSVFRSACPVYTNLPVNARPNVAIPNVSVNFWLRKVYYMEPL
jgi:hypothetical protein